MTYPDLSTEQYSYDANGNVLQKTTRSNQTIGFTYDALNRRSSKTPHGEAAGAVTYGYDLTGRLLQASDGSNTAYQIGYDTAGRADSYTDQENRNTQVQYDGVGNRTQLTWPVGTNGASASYYVTYAFDAMNRMTNIYQNGSTSTPLATYAWDPLSRQQSITYGDGTTDSYSSYDAGDNLGTLTQTYNGVAGDEDNNVNFSYTWYQNHQRASTSASNIQFQYIPTLGTTTYPTANADNGYVSLDNSATGNASFTYDGNRNMSYDGVNTLTYDVENRLIEAQNPAWGTSAYLYDPLGHRKQKQVTSPGWQVTTQFVLAGGQEIADYNGTGAGAAISLTVRGVGGLPVAAVTPAVDGATLTAVYYHHDVMGSTVAVTQGGDSGASEAYTYSDFGAPGAGSWATYRYAGYRYDNETGLYYVNARYYNPNLGRFLQTDPIGLRGGMNLYAYTGNDPLNLSDATGLAPGDVYGVTPSGLLGSSTTALQFLYGGATGTPYQHVFTEINPDPFTNAPMIAQEVPGGYQVIPLSQELDNAAQSGSTVDRYSPNVPYSSTQLDSMTSYANANAAAGIPYNYGISSVLDLNGGIQCAQAANDLATAPGVGGAAPIPETWTFIPGTVIPVPVTLPSNLSNSESYTYQGIAVNSKPAYGSGNGK